MKQWCPLYVFLYSHEFVIWPDCFMGHSCPGGICPECDHLSLTCSITTMLGTLLTIDTQHTCFHWYIFPSKCVEGVFPHSVSTRRDSCVRVYAPLTLASPLTKKKKKIEQAGPSSPIEPSEGAFELTHGSTCIIGL